MSRVRICGVLISPPLVSPPSNRIPPLIYGGAVVGGILSASTGSWAFLFSPDFQYQWVWFDTGENILGATYSTYSPVSGDVGHTLAVIVRAINDYGADSVMSLPTSLIIPISLRVSYSLTCNSILYSETGSGVNFTLVRGGGVQHYTLSGTTGQYTETGSGLTRTVARKLSQTTAQYTETGSGLTGTVARKLSQTTAQYSETGSGVNFTLVRGGGQDGALDLSDSAQTGFNYLFGTM